MQMRQLPRCCSRFVLYRRTSWNVPRPLFSGRGQAARWLPLLRNQRDARVRVLRNSPPLPHELLQGLHVGAKYPPSQGLDRFAFPIEQQALDIKRAMPAALSAPHTGQHGGQELLQPCRAGRQLARVYASAVYTIRLRKLEYTRRSSTSPIATERATPA
jgi:hypothetical protein